MSMNGIHVYVPENKQGSWGGRDTRPRCWDHDKVAFDSMERAERSAEKIREHLRKPDDEYMNAYEASCGAFHVGHNMRLKPGWKKSK